MNNIIFLILIIIIYNNEGLKLNRQRPSTVWGVQKQVLGLGKEHDHFRSRNGVYYYEYDTGNCIHQSFRKEKRSVDGTVFGLYGYVDPQGVLRITEYIAGSFGYRQRTVIRYPVQNTKEVII